MPASRKRVARVANVGLAIFGAAIVVILGTGGTRISLRQLSLDLSLDVHHLANPLLGFALFAALRLLAASRGSGLEARVVRFFAHQGLPPRDTRATPLSAVRAGAVLGLGWGLACGAADVAHALLTGAPRGDGAETLLTVASIGLAVGAALGVVAGAAAGGATYATGRALGRRPRRYEAGRWTLAALWVVSALLVRFAPAPLHEAHHGSAVLLGTTAAFALAVAAVLVAVPAAILRARRGRWGLAVVGGGGLAIALGLVALGALGPVSSQGTSRDSHHPNILVVSIPGLRVEVLGTHETGRSLTPSVDSLAAAGTTFLETITPSTELLPSAGSMLTGLYPSTHGVSPRDTPWRWPAAAMTEMLEAHGYQTGAFVGTSELDGHRTRLAELFGHYGDIAGLRGRVARLAVARAVGGPLVRERPPLRAAAVTAERFERWRGQLSPGPWFAWLQLADPLRPVPRDPPEEGATSVTAAELGVTANLDEPLGIPPSWAAPDQAAVPLGSWFLGYDDAVRRADAALGSVLAALARRGESKQTVVVLVAEHGLAIGEEGTWFECGPGLPEGVIHVPWVTAGPGVVEGRVVPGPTSLVDVAPTLLGLVGLGGGRFHEGEDLSRHLRELGSMRTHGAGPVFTSSAPHPRYDGERLHAVRLGHWKLVRTPGGRERLYFVTGNVESEITVPRGQSQRQLVALSDLLTRRLAEQARLFGQLP